ncbi:MAG: NADPH-dependent glutamate synthase [Eubacteriales bacterium]|nr:NADPH-dependent glutamate synthase [Eubacteriales bacterium]
MYNKQVEKTPCGTQDPQKRIHNFDEVAFTYTEEEAVNEASRCINCKNSPCVSGCPVGIKIPEFISKIKERNFKEAYSVISEDSALPAICGRVCPQETQCEQKCVRGIKGESVGIGRLERFAADWHMKNEEVSNPEIKENGHKVAVVGSGPSGLTAAGELRKMGYEVSIFEALHEAGGVLVYGIPAFRLPKDIVKKEIDALINMGVKIELNVVIGRTLTVDELFNKGFEAIYIAGGAGSPKFMGIPGEGLKGVLSANEYLTRINLMRAYKPDSHTPILRGKHVSVVGGGNVAMDAARCARRLGAEVSVIYRRSREELPARQEEVEHAEEEGIEFHFLQNPVKIIGDENGWVTGVECVHMQLGEPDSSGRRRPVPIEGSETVLKTDTFILALGTSPNPLISKTTDALNITRYGGIEAKDQSGATSRKGVFAGGDIVTGSATVILAMGAGKRAAKAIDEYIMQGKEWDAFE